MIPNKPIDISEGEVVTIIKPLADTRINCSEIISDYLEAHKYDGLVECNGECACDLEDFMPCGGEYAMDCRAGYKQRCTCGEGCNFHIIAGKKPSSKEGTDGQK